MISFTYFLELIKEGQVTVWEAFCEEYPLNKVFCFSIVDDDKFSATIMKQEDFYVIELIPDINLAPYITQKYSIDKDYDEDMFIKHEWLYNWAEENSKPLSIMSRKERIREYIYTLESELDDD